MKRSLIFPATLFLLLTLFLARTTPAGAALYTLSGTVGIGGLGGPLAGHDIIRDDRSTSTLYLVESVQRFNGQGTNRLDIINAQTNLQIASIPLIAGGHDVIPVDSLGVAFVAQSGGGAPGAPAPLAAGHTGVAIVSMQNFNVVANVDLGLGRADLMTFDPRDGLLAVTDGGSTAVTPNIAPKVVFLKVTSTAAPIVGTFTMPNGDTPEGPFWDGGTQLFYQLDQTANSIITIDPKTFTAVKTFPNVCATSSLFSAPALPPAPHTLAGGPNGNAALGCDGSDAIFNLASGKATPIPSLAGNQVQGTDEPWFDSVSNRYFFPGFDNGSRSVLGVVDATTNKYLEIDPTGAPKFNSKIILNIQAASDPSTQKVFFPLDAAANNAVCPAGCVAVFSVTPPTPIVTRLTPTTCTQTTAFSTTLGFQNVFTTECVAGQTTTLTTPGTTLACGAGVTNVSVVPEGVAGQTCPSGTSNNLCTSPPIYVVANPVATQAYPTTSVSFTTVTAANQTCTQSQQFP